MCIWFFKNPLLLPLNIRCCQCHSLSLASVKSRLVLPFWYWLVQVVPDKGLLNVHVCILTVSFCALFNCRQYFPSTASYALHNCLQLCCVAIVFVWQCFKSSPDKFPTFFRQLMVMSLREEGLTFKEQTILIVFLIHCFNSHVRLNCCIIELRQFSRFI